MKFHYMEDAALVETMLEYADLHSAREILSEGRHGFTDRPKMASTTVMPDYFKRGEIMYDVDDDLPKSLCIA